MELEVFWRYKSMEFCWKSYLVVEKCTKVYNLILEAGCTLEYTEKLSSSSELLVLKLCRTSCCFFEWDVQEMTPF